MLVSVVITTKNRIHFLKKAIMSVICQSYKNTEIIIIDDCSTDTSEVLIDEYLKIHSNINYYKNKEPMGANYSRNLGFQKAKGAYVAFLDDDDIWFEEKLFDQVKSFDDDKIDIVSCNFEYKKFFFNFISKIYYLPNLQKILDINYLGGMSGVVIRKSSFDKNLFDQSLQSCQDWDFWIKSILDKKKIVISQSILYKYTIHSNNKITNNLKKSYEGRKLLFFKYKNLLEPYSRQKKIYELLIIKHIINNDVLNFFKLLINLNTRMKFRLRLSYFKKYILIRNNFL